MENDLRNRMERPPNNRARRNQGRPKNKARQPERARQIVKVDGTNIIEKCPSCGAPVKMEVRTKRNDTRYVRCPACGRHQAIRDDQIREIPSE